MGVFLSRERKFTKKARSRGGKVSGEHGIGYAKRPYLAKSLSPMELQLMRGIKQVFDPQNILNPDKVIPVP